MTEYELTELCNGLIAYCQRHDMLSTKEDELISELSSISDVDDERLRDFLN